MATNAYAPKGTKKIDEALLIQLRNMPVVEVLNKLNIYWKLDSTYIPTNAGIKSRRLNASIKDDVFELIVTEVKWFDTRTNKGGGGAIDLSMHLFKENFTSAVKRLTQSK